jgi:hypothetical protein
MQSELITMSTAISLSFFLEQYFLFFSFFPPPPIA